MNQKLPFVSVIVPCRNEEEYIEDCLRSILEQDYPREKTEVLIVDGMSQDKTRQFLKKYQKQYSFIKVLDNPKMVTPSALNIGIKNSQGDIIVLFGAHAVYEKNYISKCIKYLEEYGADNVGGRMLMIPREQTLIARAIIFTLSSPFGAGNSYFRTGVEKPKWVDTVFGICCRREIFDKVGFFNEDLIRNQDIEFNLRLKRAGGKILLVHDVTSRYYVRSNLKDFFLHDLKGGIWVIYLLKFTGKPLCLRHYVPLISVFIALATATVATFFPIFWWVFLFVFILYFLISFYFSVRISVKERNIGYLFVMPVTFASRHTAYILGSIVGLIKLLKG